MNQFFFISTQKSKKKTRIHKKLIHFFIKYVYTQYYYNIVKPHTIHITSFPHNSHMMSSILPISTDVRDFLHRDVYPETERKIRRLFRNKYKTKEDYDAAVETDVFNYLLNHIWEEEKQHILDGTERGIRIKEKRLQPKIERLRCILFPDDEETDELSVSEDESEKIPLSQHMEMKKYYSDKLLDARDEIVKLHRIIMNRRVSSAEINQLDDRENVVSKEDTDRTDRTHHTDETVIEEGFLVVRPEEGIKDIDYSGVNSTLNELAMLREVRKRHGTIQMDTPEENKTLEYLIEQTLDQTDETYVVDVIDLTIDELSSRVGEVNLSGPEIFSPPSYPRSSPINQLAQSASSVPSLSQKEIERTLVQMGTISEDQLNDEDYIRLECPICYCELNTDVDSDYYTGCCVGQFCGHAMCETCWKEYRARKNKTCPVCKQLLFMGRGRPPKATVW